VTDAPDWTDRVGEDNYPYPRTSAAATELIERPIPDNMLESFDEAFGRKTARFYGEVLPYFLYNIRFMIEEEQVPRGIRNRAMLIRDMAVLESALGKLYRKEFLEDDELDMLALELDPDSPDGKRLTHDIGRELVEYWEAFHEQLKEDNEPEEDKTDADTLAVTSQLARDVKRIAIILEQERGHHRGYSSPLVN